MIKIRYRYILLIGLTGLVLPTESSLVYAQDISNKSNVQFYWVNCGLGVNSSFEVNSAGTSVSYQTGKHLISMRYVFNDESQIMGWSSSEKFWDIGVLYGRSAKASCGLASISGGIGIMGGNLRRENFQVFRTVGIPLEGQLFLRLLSFLGIGIYGFANLNLEKSFVGTLLCVQIGKLK